MVLQCGGIRLNIRIHSYSRAEEALSGRIDRYIIGLIPKISARRSWRVPIRNFSISKPAAPLLCIFGFIYAYSRYASFMQYYFAKSGFCTYVHYRYNTRNSAPL